MRGTSLHRLRERVALEQSGFLTANLPAALLSIEESIFLVRSMTGFTRKHLKKAEVIAEMLATIAQEMLDEEEKD